MVSLRLLLANGTVITASKEENKETFWAVRGAGHNFGIGLEATFQVYPQKNDGKHYVVDFEYDLDRVEDLFEAVNDVSSPMPKELAIFVIGRKRGATGGVSLQYSSERPRLTINLWSKATVNVNLVYSGPKADAQPFVSTFQSLGPVWRDEKVADWDALPVRLFRPLPCVVLPSATGRVCISNFLL